MTATVLVLFGATGDLARRMVLPAFFTLAERGLLPEEWRLVGTGRGDRPHDEFRAAVRSAVAEDDVAPDPDGAPAGGGLDWGDVAARILFAGGGFTEDDPGSLLDVLAEVRADLGDDVRFVYYLALPPAVFEPVTAALAAHGLTGEGASVVYEKPYGTSPEAFEQLDKAVHAVLDESQVFRIDHFLGKEATQNLHVLRFANQLFAGVWGRDQVAEVQIDIPETLDVADRAEFYDATGATLDMLVTHLFQVAAEVAMEPPVSMSAADLQDAREAVIAAFRPLDPAAVVLGQFDGYRELDGVPDDSTTDTFVAARLLVDTDRWRGVPFLLRTGKRMARSGQQVTLVLRDVEGPLDGRRPAHGNLVRISLAGAGGFDLGLLVKTPGPELTLAHGNARLALDDVPAGDPLPPYAGLLHDVLTGDRSLFTSSEGLRRAWRAAAPLLADRPPVQPYAPGSWGPEAAAALPIAGWTPITPAG